MKLCEEALCTGCMACLNRCPKGCITSKVNEEGFEVPYIDQEKCVNCGLCVKACPVMQPIRNDRFKEPEAYAAWHEDEAIRWQSTSGGVASALASFVLKRGGVVVGAAYNEKQEVVHKIFLKQEELEGFRGSKYVQSSIGYTYSEVKRYLKEGRIVVFIGTPCQVAGLYGYLGEEAEGLICCDFICHGVPSPEVFKRYIGEMEAVYKSKIKQVIFRDKGEKGWPNNMNVKMTFEDGQVYYNDQPRQDPYYRSFMLNISLRKSCYTCQYTNLNRRSDLTLGDYWGLGTLTPFEKQKEPGISLLLVNSKKGKDLLSKIPIQYEKRMLEEAKAGNLMLVRSAKYHEHRIAFFEDWKKGTSLKELAERYMVVHNSVRDQIAKLLGPKLTYVIRKLLKRV